MYIESATPMKKERWPNNTTNALVSCSWACFVTASNVETFVHRHWGECVDWGVARTTSRIAFKVDTVAHCRTINAFERLLDDVSFIDFNFANTYQEFDSITQGV